MVSLTVIQQVVVEGILCQKYFKINKLHYGISDLLPTLFLERNNKR